MLVPAQSPTATTSSEVELSGECTSPLGSSQVVPLHQHSWTQTGNSVARRMLPWGGFLRFVPCWVATWPLTHSGQTPWFGNRMTTWWALPRPSKEAQPSEAALHMFPKGVQQDTVAQVHYHAGMVLLHAEPAWGFCCGNEVMPFGAFVRTN